MRIGIIGAGRIGSTLARDCAAAGHDVVIANSREPQTLDGLIDELGGRVRAVTVEDAARFGEVVVVSIPFGRYRQLPSQALAGKIVIDTMNYMPERDGPFPELDQDQTTSSEMLASHLPGARVVKTFNALQWEHLRDYGLRSTALDRFGMTVSGDVESKPVVFDLVHQIGFDPIDAGDLPHGGRKHQPGAPTFHADLIAEELRARIGAPVETQ
ncbi:NADPH-dependent F420 reductase [Micromonospora peucetia]|uniref:Pyrroline-5-carboxylate reductase catalytic N-terminal domain-containing protein n=1 Tax=Micromonospora peucetia TaxID=47871 RepID=A0A1C6W4V6_9ACTN|nr:NAD(P)-binding domain-containing protein [Micromonospora peucetia]SCL73558.1 hypothetical protein GA0070608_5856 [Micromonospora peucetia]